MTDTNQLPEPELGYIKTDKSNQPAFSARQMRDAMQHALQARAQVQGEPVNLQHMAVVENGALRWMTGRKVKNCELYAMPDFGRAPTLYATPQPAQATQEEVTDGIRPEDFTVDVVVKSMGGFAQINTQGVRVTHKPTGISVTCDVARSQHANRHQAFEKLSAILALRPERVPMTEWEIVDIFERWDNTSGASMSDFVRMVEVHHGITAQAKKEPA